MNKETLQIKKQMETYPEIEQDVQTKLANKKIAVGTMVNREAARSLALAATMPKYIPHFSQSTFDKVDWASL
jgi:hypothetical protein